MNEVIEHEQPKRSFTPVQAEAVAKISKVATELNRILKDQEGNDIRIEWAAISSEGDTVAHPVDDGILFRD